jgi:hypothetical protein
MRGGQSSARHAHSKQDEFVYVIEGEFVHARHGIDFLLLCSPSAGRWGARPDLPFCPQQIALISKEANERLTVAPHLHARVGNLGEVLHLGAALVLVD